MQIETAIARIVSIEKAMAHTPVTDDVNFVTRLAERVAGASEASMKALADAAKTRGGTPEYRNALVEVSHLDGVSASLFERSETLDAGLSLREAVRESDSVPPLGGSMWEYYGSGSDRAVGMLNAIEAYAPETTVSFSHDVFALQHAREALEQLAR